MAEEIIERDERDLYPREEAPRPERRGRRDRSSSGERPKQVGTSAALGYLLAPLAITGALVGTTLLYRSAFSLDALQEVAAEETVAPESQPEATGYSGVDDPWSVTGAFTVGNAELDGEIKAFCDAFGGTTANYAEAAQTVFNNIVWGAYDERAEGEKPYGADWTLVAAKLYFGSSLPDQGVAGTGDYYEYAAALGYCLQYFGYSDVLTLPIVTYTTWGEEIGSAVCVVTDEGGNRHVCDPSLGSEGWMIDAAYVDLTVDDIGQDLTAAKMLGLTIVNRGASGEIEATTAPNTYGQGTDDASSRHGSKPQGTSATDDYGDGSDEDTYEDSYGQSQESDYGDDSYY